MQAMGAKMIFVAPQGVADPPAERGLREAIRGAHRLNEAPLVTALADRMGLDAAANQRIAATAKVLVEEVRAKRRDVGGIDALMQEYDLSSAEGVTLMCLAEALLRIPDAQTTDHFIEDKLGGVDWSKHYGQSMSFFVNASTFGLMMAGRTVAPDDTSGFNLGKLVKRLGEPVIREAVRRAMAILGRQFVMGRTIVEAMQRAKTAEAKGYVYSYDMLGEGARTMADADGYYEAYATALRSLGSTSAHGALESRPGISVKLSALHPRYEYAQRSRILNELTERVIALCELAAHHGVGLCVDAEEAERLELSLDLFRDVATASALKDWDGLGLAVQAYQKRGLATLDWLAHVAELSRRRLMVRLVKGAYWDTEIKLTQAGGFADYPVFTRKVNTDVSYLACAQRLAEDSKLFYPCYATHNANTVAAVVEMLGQRRDFEFQCLHGMGEALYPYLVERGESPYRCRIYAPVGGHEELLAYLVRRLLENGANSSFVNRIADDALPLDDIVRDPVIIAKDFGPSRHPRIPLPAKLFQERINSAGLDLNDPVTLQGLSTAMEAANAVQRQAVPLINGQAMLTTLSKVVSPANTQDVIGEVAEADVAIAQSALTIAADYAVAWAQTPVGERADCLRRAADLFEQHSATLMTVIVREAGRCLHDAHLEVREAVDFLRYYAAQAEQQLAKPQHLPSPTGETNTLTLSGRGPFLCISPWNFPVAIFTGQVAAALAAGCPAIAKPAEQTPLCGGLVVELLLQAGIPPAALQFLPGDGPTLGDALIPDDRLAGVVFTGSIETAKVIGHNLAARRGPLVPFIAETGGINAMIVDSTALPEQVTRDVLASAFQSAGQRCSALRLLCLQEDIAERQLTMIAGAMQELQLGPPERLATDIGPVIDTDALQLLQTYSAKLEQRRPAFATTPLPQALADQGYFFAPRVFELDRLSELKDEIFGPVLHVVRFTAGGIDRLMDDINNLGYGLTLSIHSRSDSRVQALAQRARIGNIYVNRNQIGAVVGVQPFGGEGLSGTGPKAGGPHYLSRFLVERTVSVDTTASGGNASLMTLAED